MVNKDVIFYYSEVITQTVATAFVSPTDKEEASHVEAGYFQL